MMTDPLGCDPEVVEGVDWSNDDLFFTHEWWDETSQFDDNLTKRWNPVRECYEVRCKARVPVVLRKSKILTELWIQVIIDNLPDVKGFWVE